MSIDRKFIEAAGRAGAILRFRFVLEMLVFWAMKSDWCRNLWFMWQKAAALPTLLLVQSDDQMMS
ncbi:hypothetical protein THS27_01550 [Thalassospira sp. MCCC 1A01428]|nr:hypothetical protein THS27_01550 [Thalassospira sp. MCCC 1A01428]